MLARIEKTRHLNAWGTVDADGARPAAKVAERVAAVVTSRDLRARRERSAKPSVMR